MKRTLVSLTLASVLGIATLAQAQEAPDRAKMAKQAFAAADTDKDGKLSFAEFRAHLDRMAKNPNRPADAPPPPSEAEAKQVFSRIDENKDNFIDLPEFEKAPPPPPRK